MIGVCKIIEVYFDTNYHKNEQRRHNFPMVTSRKLNFGHSQILPR